MKRGDRYYLRARVPYDLVHAYEKQEIKRALRTSDRREADRLVRIESAKVERDFEEKRRRSTKSDQPIETVAPYVLEDIAQNWFRSRLERSAKSGRDDFIYDPKTWMSGYSLPTLHEL